MYGSTDGSPPFLCSKQDDPTLIGSLTGKNVVQLAVGANYSAAVTEDGLLFTWGKGSYGRLGHSELGEGKGEAYRGGVALHLGKGFLWKAWAQ